MSASVIYRQEIEDFLASQGVAAVKDQRWFGHDCYALFDEEFIAGKFAQGLANFQFQLRVKGYREADNSCWDFSQDALFYARWVFRQDADRQKGCAICAGQFHFLKIPGDISSSHCINFFVVRDAAGNKKLIPFEPQRNIIIEFTRPQAATCFRYNVA